MANHIEKGKIESKIESKIATVTFTHPASNSFPSELLAQLTSEITNLGQNPSVLIIVLQSQGNGVFCAGASFAELQEIENQEQGTRFFSGFAHLINAMRKCPKIIIGRIQGKAVGGGVGIIAACDYALASAEAAIKLSELTIGIGPFVIEPALSRKIGKTAFAQLSLEAHHWKTVAWANEKGLYNNTFATIQALDEALLEISCQLASYNPEALIEMKKLFWENTQDWEQLLIERAKISGKLILSDYSKQALQQIKK
jgi:methylglutaconyl-CoA hydratase